VPPDEEEFESLAARVRPLLLDEESTCHSKVTKALKRLLCMTSIPDAEQYRDELHVLRERCGGWLWPVRPTTSCAGTRGDDLGTSPLLSAVFEDDRDQRRLGREIAICRAHGESGSGGDLVRRHVLAPLGERLRGHLDQPDAVPARW
jgi:hypothetical protein